MPDKLKNLLRRGFDPVFTQLAVSAGYRMEQNIALALQREAVSSTAAYVLRRMATTPAFKSRDALLRFAAEKSRADEGLVLEFGVWQGQSLRTLAQIFDQKIYGFDSFQGLPEDWRSGSPGGTFALERPPQVPPNAELVIGWFNATLDGFLATHPGRIKFLHIDCDLYSSTLQVLTGCAERLDQGSIIVFDEYFNYPNWKEGEFKAFQEVTAANQIGYEYLGYVGTNEQVAIEIASTKHPTSSAP
jgi:hypothetical protein